MFYASMYEDYLQDEVKEKYENRLEELSIKEDYTEEEIEELKHINEVLRGFSKW